jgi:putative DNA primase/helicase
MTKIDKTLVQEAAGTSGAAPSGIKGLDIYERGYGGAPRVWIGREAAERFIELLTGDGQTSVCFRAVYDATKEERKQRLEDGLPTNPWGKKDGALRNVYEWLKRANAVDADQARQAIYVVINEGGQDAASIRKIRAVFIDADVESGKGIPLNEVEWHQPPTFIVRRGNNYHAYWLTTEDFPLDQFTLVQKRLAKHYRSDPAVCDLPRIMRVPGFHHLKSLSNPKAVELVDPLPWATGANRASLDLCGLIYCHTAITEGLPELEEHASDGQCSICSAEPELPFDFGRPDYGPMSLVEARYILSFNDPTCDGEKDSPGYKDWAGRIKAVLYDPEALPIIDEEGELLVAGHPACEALGRDWCSGKLWNERTGESRVIESFVSWEHVKAEINDRLLSKGLKIRWGTFIREARKVPDYIPHDRAKLPIVLQVAGQIHQTVRHLDKALARAKSDKHPDEPAIYRQRGRFVTVEDEEGDGHSALERSKGVPVIKTVTLPKLKLLGAQYARIERYLKTDGWIPANLADEYGKAYLESGARACPFLQGVIETPTILPDGTILQTAGYNAHTRLLLRLSDEFPAIPDQPTRQDAQRALKELLNPFRAVEFESGKGQGIDADVIAAAILTGIARPSIDKAPMFLVSATLPGSGKTATSRAISMIVTGHAGTVITLASSEEETEKRLGAALMEGDQVLILDNCSHALHGDFLCAMLTSPECHPRRLGLSKNVRCSTRALVIATGNNLEAKGDLARRCVVSYNRPTSERPHERHFDFDLEEEVRRDRRLLVVAGLTLMRAYFAAGCPNVGAKPSGFTAWDKFVRFPIIWAGGCDIQRAMEKARQSDPQRAALGAVSQAWHGCYGFEQMFLADVGVGPKARQHHSDGQAIARAEGAARGAD